MSSQSCTKKFCKKRVSDEVKRLKKFGKNMAKEFKVKTMSKAKRRIFDEDRIKRLQARCEMEFCNPTCKGTILEAGKNISNALKNEYKKIPIMLNMERKTRKNIFGKNTNVLKNGFYKKLEKNTVNALKKNGALSKCFI